MKKRNIAKIVIAIFLIVLAVVIAKLFSKTSFGADNEERAILEGAFNKYVNYELKDGSRGTLVQYSLRTGIKYENDFFAIKGSELNITLNQIDGKYPYDVKVIAKSTKATNGKTSDISEDYSYDSNTGSLIIRTSNENENGDAIYNERPGEEDRDEFVIISYYDTFTNEQIERELSCNVTYRAVLFTEDNREVTTGGILNKKVTEDVGELTSIDTNVSNIYNGYIKSNVINGTAYDTDYTENNEIMISKKEAHQKIEITEENTFVNLNDICYKSTKILKDDILNVLGENGKIEILDANNNIIANIDNNTQFNENGEFIVTYGNDVNSILIKTSDIINEGILHIENVKSIKSGILNLDDKDITRKISIVGINEKEIEINAESQESASINIGTLNLNTNNVNSNENTYNIQNNEEKEIQIVEEESYRAEKEDVIEIKDATTSVDVNVNNTNWTNESQNDVTFDIYLNSNSNEYNLFKNPTVRINLPSEVEKVVLNDSQLFYANGLNLVNSSIETNADGSLSIVANIDGNQTQYNENNLGLITDLKLSTKIILKKDIENVTGKVNVFYTNNYSLENIEEGNIEKTISIQTYNEDENQNDNKESSGTATNGNQTFVEKVEEVVNEATDAASVEATTKEVNGLKLTVEPIVGDKVLKDGDTVYTGEFIKYNVTVENTTDEDINNVKVIAKIPEGTKYGELESKFDSLSDKKYEYTFDEKLQEKEINIGTVKAGKTYTNYYEIQVEDLNEGETEKALTSNIDLYIGSTQAATYVLNNTIQASEVKAFLWSKLEGSNGEWVYGVNLSIPEGQEAIVTINFPEQITITQESIDRGQSYVKAYESEYSTALDSTGELIGSIDDFEYYFDVNKVIITTKHSGTYAAEFKIKDDTAIRECSDTGNAELPGYATVKIGDVEYKSNENRTVYQFESASITMTSENEGEEVVYGEEIKYNIAITCTGTPNAKDEIGEVNGIYVNVLDYLPEELDPVSATYDFYEVEYETKQTDYGEVRVPSGFSEKTVKTEDISFDKTDGDGNRLPETNLFLWIPYQETVNVEIETTAGFVTQKTEISNSATVQNPPADSTETSIVNTGIKTKESNVIKHFIVPKKEDVEDPDKPTDPDDPDKPTDPDDPNIPVDPEVKYDISGVAWKDSNRDGSRQSTEELLSGIEVLLVDLRDSSNVKASTTTSNGRYTFTDLEQSNYIVVFRYNTTLYSLTEYKESGVSDEVNSDAMDQNIILDGQNVDVGVTDEINLTKDMNNIDIGLIEKEGYDLKLDKYITDVTVTTVNGTKQYSYDNTKLGRVEIRAKELNGAVVTIKYRIVVTNEGKASAKVNEIYDYLPDGLSFATTDNNNWTNQNGKLVNKALTNQQINPGESKEVTLTLTKTMGEEDTGTFINAAEIGSVDNNTLGIQDVDSTPGNSNKSEDDYSEAQMIISVSTGLAVYISIGVITVIAVAILIVVIIKFKINTRKITKIGFSILVFTLVGLISSSYVSAAAPRSTTYTYGDWKTYVDHHFTGGPSGDGYCQDHSLPAAGWSYIGCNHTETYTWSYDTNVNTSYGDKITLEDPIDLQKRNETIEVRQVGDRYVLGPFMAYSNANTPFVITITDKNGAVINGWATCDENGNGNSGVSGPGDVNFYISLPASALKTGISRIKVEQTKTWRYKMWYSRTARSFYISNARGVSCTVPHKDGTSVTYYSHQDVLSTVYETDSGYIERSEETTAEIEWTDFNSTLDVYKVDADDHEILIDIEGNLSKNDGTFSEDFKTENGKYHWDNLRPGNYTLTETFNDNYGYEKNEGIQVPVVVDSGTAVEYYFENIKYTGNLKIVKKDKDSESLMPDVGFKLQAAEGYVIGIDDSGNKITTARGQVHFSDMEYTQDISQATEFFTDDNGVSEILNIRIGTYTVIETSIDIDKYGYELDDDYIFWSSGMGSGQGAEGQVEVIRRESFITTPKNHTLTDSDYDIITYENRRKWIKLSGDVWEDMISSKRDERDYRYTSGDSTEDNPDRLLANVVVKLKDASGNTVPFKTEDTFIEGDSNRGSTVDEILTDENGHYLMIDILIDEIPNYYIEFSYNGMSYASVPLIEELLNNEKGGTKAIENANTRTEFNRKYSEITHSGTTGPIGESRDDTGSKTYDLNYDTDQTYDGSDQIKSTLNYGPNSKDSDAYGYSGQKFPINANKIDEQYVITATTRDAYLSVAGNSGYLDDMYTPEEIRQQEKEEIPNIDLGVYEREQPDLALVEDIETVKVILNGYEHTYNYNQRFEDQNKDGFNVGVKFENEYGSAEYTQAVYPSDVVYNQGHSDSLGIYVRYKIALRNEGTDVYTTVNEIVNYFDSRYDIANDEYVPEGITDEEGNPLEYSEENYDSSFKKVTIQTNQNLESQKTKYIYITYKLQNDVINDLFNNIPPLESISEITSYSTYSDSGFSVHYAGVDKDSRPGSAEPGNEDSYEDDTDEAPGFVLEIQEARAIRGTVWEDEAVQEFLDGSGREDGLKERIGNGTYDEGTENMIQDVKVDLIKLSYEADSNVDLAAANLLGEANGTEPEIALLYKQGNTNGEEATTTTDKNGNYEFSGVIPGKYLLRFTYGNNSIIVKADGSGTETIDDVDKYKSTIYRGNRPENESTAAGDTDWWYRQETSGEESAQRWSDARDEIGINGNGKFDLLEDRFDLEKEYYYGNTSSEVIDTNPDVITDIESRSRGFEIKMDYDINLDNMSTYQDQTTGKLKFIFDNMDFGIIRRPIQRLTVEKQIAYVQVRLANGQVVIEGDPRTENIEHLRFLPDGNVHIELDSELIQGATLTIRYQFIADNTDSEIDYNDENYYLFGTPKDPSTLAVPKIKRLLDYLSNELTFNPDINTAWKLCTADELEEWHNNKYLSDDAYEALKEYNQVLQTDAFKDMGLERKDDVYLEVSRILSNNVDDLVFDNDMEVNILTGRRTTKYDDDKEYTVPGDYIPSNGDPGGDDDYRNLIVTGPTGENQNYIPYIVLGISAFIILSTGIIFIKKKVL